jgi:hypothetical protein
MKPENKFGEKDDSDDEEEEEQREHSIIMLYNLPFANNIRDALLAARIEKDAGNTYMSYNLFSKALKSYHRAINFFRDWQLRLTNLSENPKGEISEKSESGMEKEIDEDEYENGGMDGGMFIDKAEPVEKTGYYLAVELAVSEAKQIILCNTIVCLYKIVNNHQEIIEARKKLFLGEDEPEEKEVDVLGQDGKMYKIRQKVMTWGDEDLDEEELQMRKEKKRRTAEENIAADHELTQRQNKIVEVCTKGLAICDEVLSLPELQPKYKEKALHHKYIFYHRGGAYIEAVKALQLLGTECPNKLYEVKYDYNGKMNELLELCKKNVKK